MPRNANQSKSTNYSLDFVGGNYINASTLSVTGDWSVSLWVNSNSTSYQSPIQLSSQQNDSTIFLYEHPGGASAKWGFYDGATALTGLTALNTGQWYHLVVTKSGTTYTLFLNGTQESQGTLANINIDDFLIGRRNYNNFYMDGKIDAVAIFDYALSESQVTTLYGTGSAIGNPMALPSPPIAYYPLGTSAWNGQYLAENNAIGDYVFDFSSDVINTNSLGISGANSRTISCWFNADSTSNQNIIGFGAASQGNNFTIAIYNSNIFAHTWNTGGVGGDLSGSAVTAGKWHLAVMTYDGTNLKISLDGGTYATTTASLNTTNSIFKIGSSYYTAWNLFSGKISNTKVWNTDLSQAEVTTLYNNGSPIRTLASIPQSSNLKAWYKLDAGEIYNLLSVDGFSATDNTGGGGGGGGSKYVQNPLYVGNGGSGGSGIVVLKYPTNLNAAFSAGLTKSDVINGSNTITSIKSGTGTVAFGNAGTISDYLIVAGGGGGGSAVNFAYPESTGGGGGGGGLLTGTSLSVSAQSYNITIGEGGSGGLKTISGTIGSQGENGQDSTFSTLTAIGGGGGGAAQVYSNALSAGKNGGSGGGPGGSSGALTSAGGTGSQGSDGGAASTHRSGGGGGGYSNAGTAATSNTVPGNGGDGYLYSLTSTYYAGGGGGGAWYNTGTVPSGGLSGDGSTGIGGAPKQQGDITPEGPNFTNWWRILDNSNNSNDGASISMDQSNLVQSDLQTVAPYSKYAMNFDGNDYIDLGSDSSLDIAGNDFSCSLWFNTTTTASGQPLFALEAFSNKFAMTIEGGSAYKNVAFSFNWNTGGVNTFYYDGGNNLTDGNWHNYIITKQGTTVQAYIDGSTITFGNLNGTATSSNANRIARWYHGYYSGKISNTSLWDKQLSSSEVREIYNQGLPSNLNSHSAYSNLVSWWQLGENSSFNGNDWIVADEIGSNNGDSNGMGVDALTNGVGTTANGTSTGMSEGSLVGDAPYSTANAISSGMAVQAFDSETPPNVISGRSEDVPS